MRWRAIGQRNEFEPSANDRYLRRAVVHCVVYARREFPQCGIPALTSHTDVLSTMLVNTVFSAGASRIHLVAVRPVFLPASDDAIGDAEIARIAAHGLVNDEASDFRASYRGGNGSAGVTSIARPSIMACYGETPAPPCGGRSSSARPRNFSMGAPGSGLSRSQQADIWRVERFGERRQYRRGERLFAAGERTPGMFVVLKGALTMTARDGLGRTAQVVRHGPGQFTGEVAQLSTGVAVVDADAWMMMSKRW